MKLKIDKASLVESFFEYTCILGIVAPVKDYLLIWNINQVLGFNMYINHSLEVQLHKKGRDYFFSVYEYKVPGTGIVHSLYNNHDDGEYLLPEFRHLDFVWLISGECTEDLDSGSLQSALKVLPSVQLVNEIPFEKIKNRENLII
ncbi:MAG: IPExxxVDY family protein [Niastella sp.]|nr:IPExxxVDY family protein [Niastella sp.]